MWLAMGLSVEYLGVKMWWNNKYSAVWNGKKAYKMDLATSAIERCILSETSLNYTHDNVHKSESPPPW